LCSQILPTCLFSHSPFDLASVQLLAATFLAYYPAHPYPFLLGYEPCPHIKKSVHHSINQTDTYPCSLVYYMPFLPAKAMPSDLMGAAKGPNSAPTSAHGQGYRLLHPYLLKYAGHIVTCKRTCLGRIESVERQISTKFTMIRIGQIVSLI